MQNNKAMKRQCVREKEIMEKKMIGERRGVKRVITGIPTAGKTWRQDKFICIAPFIHKAIQIALQR